MSGPGPRRDLGGTATLTVVLVLAAVLAALSALWPAAVPTPSDNRQPVTEQTRPVGDLPFTAVANGLGPVSRDRGNGGVDVDDGGPITIAGQVYERGLGVHAPSRVRLYPAGTCDRFVAEVGLDDAGGGTGSVLFQVVADGVGVYGSGPVTGRDRAVQVEVDIDGVGVLDLIVTDAGDGDTGDLADWAGAALVCPS